MAITLGDLIVRIRGEQGGLDGDLRQAESRVNASAGRMGGFFTGALQHAVGGAILGGVRTVMQAATNTLSEAFDATAGYESMSAALNTLLTKEIQTNSVQTKRVLTGYQTIEVTEGGRAANLKKGESEVDLSEKIQKTNAQLAVQRERLAEAIAAGKESTAEIDLRKVRIGALESALVDLNNRTAQAGTVTQQQVATYKEEKTAAMDIIEARKLAAVRTEELLKWSQKLAIQSPYGQDDVIKALKMAMALGYNSDQAQRLTQANINFASATGASGEVMSRISLALGQMYTKGRLMGGEMLQLTEAGVPMKQMLIESGKIAGLTAENFEDMQRDGLLPAKLAYEAYVEYIEKNFNTAAKDQANTLKGLQNSWEDLKKVVLRVGLGPIFKAMQPAIQKVVDLLQTPKFMASVERIGQGLGDFFTAGVGNVLRFFEIIDTNVSRGIKPIDAFRLALLNILPPEFIPLVNTITDAVNKFQTSFAWSQDAGYAIRQALKVAFGDDFDQTIGAMLQKIIGLPGKLSEAFTQIKAGKPGEALDGLWSSLGLGTIDVAGAVAGLLKKLTDAADNGNTIKAVGDSFFGWGAAALKWMDEKITSADFEAKITGENGIAAKLGAAAGNTVSAIFKALKDWILALVNFSDYAKPEEMEQPIVRFVKAWAASINKNKQLVSDIAQAFWKGFLEGLGVESPKAEELAKLLDNPLQYATQVVGPKIGLSIRSTLAQVFAGVVAGITLKVAEIGRMLAAYWVDLQGKVEIAWNNITAAITHPIDSALTWLTGLGERMGSIGKGIVDGLIAGIRNKAGEVKAAMLALLPPAMQSILRQMGIASPSKVTMGISNHIMDGFLLPFEQRAGEMADALTGLIQPMTQVPAMSPLAPSTGSGFGGGRGDIIINMNGASIKGDMDAYSVAYRIAKRVRDGV